MKSAEEWHHSLYSSRHGQCELITTDEIKQIQLDAMKEGMRRAANMTSQHHMETLIQQQEMRQAILTAAEQLTEKDL